MSDDPAERVIDEVGKTVGSPAPAGGYRVELRDFEGPLDLLLHLIKEHELDILNIPIGFIAEKFVEYITLMQELNIDVASEYLVMAATLAHIKSKMVLPSTPEDQDEEGEEELDPRADLVRRLLEYQKYKHAGETLGARAVLGRDVFGRSVAAPAIDGPAPLAPVSLFKLLDAFQAVLKRAKGLVDHEIDLDRFTITDRIHQLSERLSSRRRLGFEELFEGQKTRADLILTFLALLEMTRLRVTRLSQDTPLGAIYIELAVTDDDAGADASEARADSSAESFPEPHASIPESTEPD